MAIRKGTGKKNAANDAMGSGEEVQTRRSKAASSAPKSRSKKSSPGGTNSRSSWVILFWAAFAVFIFGLFLFNREAIGNTLESVKNRTAAALPEEEAVPPGRPDTGAPASPLSAAPSPAESSSRPEQTPSPREDPVSPSAVQTTPPVPPARSPDLAAPAAQTAPASAVPDTRAQAANPPRQTPPELRERSLYFIQVDRDGAILRIKVNRRLPLSDSPLTDAVQALITGPDGDEKARGLISLIPENTRILSATVRGETAYISFSEDFQYNTYGVEGYAGQVRQIVFTATEFPNVRDVQILIEGRRIDYLGEGVWVGSPLNRDML